MSGKSDVALLLGSEPTARRNRSQDGNAQMVQWLVILVGLLLVSNLMMMGMMAYGFAFLRAEVNKANHELHTAMETVNAVGTTFGNITSNIRLLPASLFDFVTRVMTIDFVSFATKVDQVTSLYLQTLAPPPGSVPSYVYSYVSLVQGMAHAIRSVQEVPSPLPPFSGPVDVADFAVFQTLEWLNNQTDPVSMQRAGAVCTKLLNNVNAAFSAGAFTFFYRCVGNVDGVQSWTMCPFELQEYQAAPYIGPNSIAAQICKQLQIMGPGFFSGAGSNQTAKPAAEKTVIME